MEDLIQKIKAGKAAGKRDQDIWKFDLNQEDRGLFLQLFPGQSLTGAIKAAQNPDLNQNLQDLATAGSIDSALLTYWQLERQNDLQIREEIAKRIGTDQKKQDLILTAIRNRQLWRQAEKIEGQLTLNQKAQIETLASTANPKPSGFAGTTLFEEAFQASQTLVAETAYQLAKQTGAHFSPAQIQQATDMVTVSLTAGGCRLDDSNSLAVTLDLALAQANPNYAPNTPLHQVADLVQPAPNQTSNPTYSAAFGTVVALEELAALTPTLDQIVNHVQELDQVVQGAQTPSTDPHHLFVEDQVLTSIQNKLDRTHQILEQSPQIQALGDSLQPQPTPDQFKAALEAAGVSLNPPDAKAAYLIGTLQATKIHDTLSPTTVMVMSLSATDWQKAQEYAQAHPNSPLAQLNGQYGVFRQVNQQLNFWSRHLLGKEIGPHTNLMTGPVNFFNRLPGGIGRPVGRLLQLPQSVSGWLNQKAGQVFGRQILGKIAVSQIGKNLLSQGLTKGLGMLAKQAGTKIAVALLGNAGLAATGIGAPLAAILAAVQIGWGLLKGLLQPILGDIKARDLVTAPLVLGGALAAAIPITITAGTAIAASVVTTVVVSTVVAVFMYLTAFTTAPLISTLAHLETGGSLGYFAGGFTGPVPEGCPQGRPYDGQFNVGQPPGGGYSHQSPPILYRFTTSDGQPITLDGATSYLARTQAYDLGTPLGTPVKATHNGVAYPFTWGSMPGYGGYGNFVVVKGKCQGKEFFTVYGHMLSLALHTTQTVTQGTILGWANNTGHSTATHLHYELIPATMNIKDYFQP